MLNILILSAISAVLIYLGYRIFRLIKRKPNRFFPAFWVWPLLWFALLNFVPYYKCNPIHFNALELLMALALLLDFFYFFGIKAQEGRLKQQYWSLLWLLPCLVIFFRHQLIPGPEMNLPHHGKALVWTNSVWQPSHYYFMAYEDPLGPTRGKAYDDPNFGKAIFAPLDAVYIGEGKLGFYEFESKDGLRFLIGPIMTETFKLKPGDRIWKTQPLGLVGESSGPIPGLQLQLINASNATFHNAYVGRRLGWLYEKSGIKRNQFVENPKKFIAEK